MDAITEKDSVEVKSYWHSDKTVVWRERLKIFSLFSDNLKILLEQTSKVDWFYEEYKQQIILLCRKFIHILMNEFFEVDFEETQKDTREYRLIQTFDCVHNYLESKGGSARFLSMLKRT